MRSPETYPWTGRSTNPVDNAEEAGAFLAAVDPDELSGRFDLSEVGKKN